MKAFSLEIRQGGRGEKTIISASQLYPIISSFFPPQTPHPHTPHLHPHAPSCCGGRLVWHRCCLSWSPGSADVSGADGQRQALAGGDLRGPNSAAPLHPRTRRSTPPPPSALKHPSTSKCRENMRNSRRHRSCSPLSAVGCDSEGVSVTLTTSCPRHSGSQARLFFGFCRFWT